MKDQEQWHIALDFIRYISESGLEAYIVGGAVRDYYLHRPVHDFDIVTNASRSDIEKLFTHVITPTHRFNTWIVRWYGLLFEVTPYRSKAKWLEEDVKLRDFTINSLAVDKTGVMIDTLNAKEDLDNGIIRTIHPDKRFSEDPLRIMRALRFVSQLEFKIEYTTWHACLCQQSQLETVPVERIQAEIVKLLAGNKHSDALYLMFFYGFPTYFPERIQVSPKDSSKKRYNMNRLQQSIEKWSAFMWLLYKEDAKFYCKQWLLPKRDTKKIQSILKRCSRYPESIPWDETLIYETGEMLALQTERVHQWLKGTKSNKRLQYISSVYYSLPIKSRKELFMNGRDLLELFPDIKKEEIGHYLNVLELAVIRRNIPNKKAELAAYIKEKRLNER
ncbi:CCA tRNA nucleotidyltransferase [Salibacterium salarium]|uniref:CCA tRNA nucleotidyltransferase n=1 Tax=Salibacterium salarium TaxID=284579 RepID=A0A3R9Q516_9BACI|nr:CCA tRNA nucleotidyltransferase [Salibacterium salarium]RSL33787.1 CCA tRNA nucleotidyltransferase [Salibacterium salarium]